MRDHSTLRAWQAARGVVRGVFEIRGRYWRPWIGPALEQLGRSALSVQLNIAEGYAFGPSPSCTRHLMIAYGSAIETADLLALLAEFGAVPADLSRALLEQNRESQACIAGLLKRRGAWNVRKGPAS